MKIRLMLFVILIQQNLISTAQNVILPNVKENTFYIGIDNHLSITEGIYECKSIKAKIENGFIEGENCNYTIRVEKPALGRVILYKIINLDTVIVKTVPFDAQYLPLPTAKIYGAIDGKINAPVFKYQTGIFAILENFDFEIKYEILSFKLMLLRKTREPKYFEANDAYFTDEMKTEILNRVTLGDEILLYDIRCKAPQGHTLFLVPVAYLIE